MVFMSSLRSVPVVPDTIPQPVAYPTANLLEFDMDTCQSEVVEPALLSDFQLPHAFRKRFWSSFPGNGFEVLFERLPALVTDHQLVFALYTRDEYGNKFVPQYFKLNRTAYAAFWALSHLRISRSVTGHLTLLYNSCSSLQ